ncbi:hypothetical protein CP556_22015 [Natrinema sp. CBA1119]|nr:hypothetical protein CP556_22015 [Natrinema sp. CBA1119]
MYPNLDTVVNKDLVEKGQLDRRTNYYAITENGEDDIFKQRERIPPFTVDAEPNLQRCW